jgi:hypothetical protein
MMPFKGITMRQFLSLYIASNVLKLLRFEFVRQIFLNRGLGLFNIALFSLLLHMPPLADIEIEKNM